MTQGHSGLHLVQLLGPTGRQVAKVDGPSLVLLEPGCPSVYSAAQASLTAKKSLGTWVEQRANGERLDYDCIYKGHSEWKLLVPVDHPLDPTRCLVSGTGLTHLGSAKDRQAMHAAPAAESTDSMKMFQLGLNEGRPKPGAIGAAPEWFYKGSGTILRAHGEPLEVPAYAEDGGEEAEIAGVYFVDPKGSVHRLGMVVGNEFSDHVFEKRNYLNLAGSKIRTCSVGPELVIAPDFSSVPGKVTIERGGKPLWSKEIATGESEMCHSLRNIEHHHFKFETHRRPGDLHVHFYGAHSLSFGAGVKLADGDVMEVAFTGFGRPLRNPLKAAPKGMKRITVQASA